MNIIKKIYAKTYKSICFLISFSTSRYLRLKTKPLKDNEMISGSFLILVPHADDEWVGCSRLLEEKSNNITLCYMDMSGGDTKEIHTCRYLELSKMAKMKNANLIHLEGNTEIKVGQLKNVIENHRTDYICVPACYDWHQEHLEVIKMLRKVLLNSKCSSELKILMYQVSVPMPKNMITNGISMNKREQKGKWLLFREIYKTQDFFPVERFMHNEFVNGGFMDSYSAEVYGCMSYKQWISFIERRVINERQRKEIEKCFKKLIKIRKVVKKIEEKNGKENYQVNIN